jgi:putative ATP-dependent endonuclease of OLD family
MVTLRIDLLFEFPELADPAKIAGAPAAMFKHLTVQKAGEPPSCCARLEATWTPSTLAEGDIDQKAEWVLVGGPEGERFHAISAADRANIVVHYVPATRDPIRHIRKSAGSILHGFLRAVSWTKETKDAVELASNTIRDSIGAEVGMKTINSLVEKCWHELHKESTHQKVVIQPVAKSIEELIAQVETIFQPAAADSEESADRLSDGQRSLFYIALVAMSFDVQARLRLDKTHGLEEDMVRNPVLTILAVEEPENHVSPHFLGRIVTLLKRIASDAAGQVVLTSHSPSIMARVDPESVRHLSHNPSTKRTSVRRITLPAKGSDKERFIREAAQAYPELYFAKLVILGEGDSEALVIPRITRAITGVDIDTNLISFVPLGGRHVNHFWRLLKALEIPHVTMLDLDLGREGGGWGRIKYALDQLMALGAPKDILKTIGKDGLAKMHTWPATEVDDKMLEWIKLLEDHHLYFSPPLDLDFAMLSAFPGTYKKLEDGERGPNAASEEALLNAVLGEKSPAAAYYQKLGTDALLWYRYLFLGRGKPATHALALGQLKDAELP